MDDNSITLHRIISGILMICIVIPLWIIHCVVLSLFAFFNAMHYINFWKLHTDVTTENMAREKGIYGTVPYRIALVFLLQWVTFRQSWSQLKTIKF